LARTHYRSRREAEQRFPHKVDIPVPSMTGLGGRLNEMLVWSRENVAASERAQHGYVDRRPGEFPTDYVRFYFAAEDKAAEFKERSG
jgi:hypothetical protein